VTSRSTVPPGSAWAHVREHLHTHGLRWTPQRRTLVDVLSRTKGHITGSELVERCRELDPATIPSTVYRTLDVLEELGLVRHAHGPDGREEFHVLPTVEHGHLHCERCGVTWEIDADEGREIVRSLESRRGFAVDLSHVTIVGVCAGCRTAEDAG
jgi:Fur family ferric uptake transcriptional regulator